MFLVHQLKKVLIPQQLYRGKQSEALEGKGIIWKQTHWWRMQIHWWQMQTQVVPLHSAAQLTAQDAGCQKQKKKTGLKQKQATEFLQSSGELEFIPYALDHSGHLIFFSAS